MHDFLKKGADWESFSNASRPYQQAVCLCVCTCACLTYINAIVFGAQAASAAYGPAPKLGTTQHLCRLHTAVFAESLLRAFVLYLLGKVLSRAVGSQLCWPSQGTLCLELSSAALFLFLLAAELLCSV